MSFCQTRSKHDERGRDGTMRDYTAQTERRRVNRQRARTGPEWGGSEERRAERETYVFEAVLPFWLEGFGEVEEAGERGLVRLVRARFVVRLSNRLLSTTYGSGEVAHPTVPSGSSSLNSSPTSRTSSSLPEASNSLGRGRFAFLGGLKVDRANIEVSHESLGQGGW